MWKVNCTVPKIGASEMLQVRVGIVGHAMHIFVQFKNNCTRSQLVTSYYYYYLATMTYNQVQSFELITFRISLAFT